jgi:hypothetical protein
MWDNDLALAPIIYNIYNTYISRSSPFFFKKNGKRENGKNGKSKKTGKRESGKNGKNGKKKAGKRETGKREIFKNNFYINFINGLANQSIFIVY